MHWTNTKNYERAGGCPTRHSQVKDGYTNSNRRIAAFASRANCAAVIFTTRVNSIMDYSVESGLWGHRTRVNGFWLVVTRMARRYAAALRPLCHLPRGHDSRGAPPATGLQALAGIVRQRGGRGCEGFILMHNVRDDRQKATVAKQLTADICPRRSTS